MSAEVWTIFSDLFAAIVSLANLLRGKKRGETKGEHVERRAVKMPSRNGEHLVYCAHDTADKELVGALSNVLEKRGFVPFRRQVGAIDYKEIEGVLSLVDAVAVFYGPHGLDPWDDFTTAAVVAECAKRQRPIVPVILPGANESAVSKLLVPFGLIRFESLDDQEAIEQFIQGIAGQDR